jgi:hypothetical protein
VDKKLGVAEVEVENLEKVPSQVGSDAEILRGFCVGVDGEEGECVVPSMADRVVGQSVFASRRVYVHHLTVIRIRSDVTAMRSRKIDGEMRPGHLSELRSAGPADVSDGRVDGDTDLAAMMER